jgi:hypothetical protein
MTESGDIRDMGQDALPGLLRDAALNWLAHDGLWFRALEDAFGLEAAMEHDRRAWEFTIPEKL